MAEKVKAAPELKPGDVVVLKSGGPNMVVAEDTGKDLSCRWWNGAAYVSACFVPECLRLATTEEEKRAADDSGRAMRFVLHDPVSNRVEVLEASHNAGVLGRNVVAVIGGGLCPVGECKICDTIRRRVRSRNGL
jgi:uncharacterized protein YodC (DUF2158 family)